MKKKKNIRVGFVLCILFCVSGIIQPVSADYVLPTVTSDGTVFSDNFESGLGAWTIQVTSAEGQVSIAEDRVFSSTKSMFISAAYTGRFNARVALDLTKLTDTNSYVLEYYLNLNPLNGVTACNLSRFMRSDFAETYDVSFNTNDYSSGVDITASFNTTSVTDLLHSNTWYRVTMVRTSGVNVDMYVVNTNGTATREDDIAVYSGSFSSAVSANPLPYLTLGDYSDYQWCSAIWYDGVSVGNPIAIPEPSMMLFSLGSMLVFVARKKNKKFV